jgi:hypothetical protein
VGKVGKLKEKPYYSGFPFIEHIVPTKKVASYNLLNGNN